MYSGLIGPLVICKKSLARNLGFKKEIEEFALLFMVFDENQSWFLDDNIKAHVKDPPKGLKEDAQFIESNKMHGEHESINEINQDVTNIIKQQVVKESGSHMVQLFNLNQSLILLLWMHADLKTNRTSDVKPVEMF